MKQFNKRKKINGIWKFDDEYNPIIEYFQLIENGEIKVSKKVYRVVKKLVDDIDNNTSIYYYDNKKAHKPIIFIENFIFHFKGKQANKPFILELWQRVIIAAFFGFINGETDLRKYKELLLIIARKNGKSTFSSAIATYLQYADDEHAPNLASVATQKEQSKIIWETTKKFISKSPYLSKRARTLNNEIITDFNDGSFKPLASESNSLDGLDLHAIFIDELHAIKDKNLYDVVVDGMGAREQPCSIITTTAGTVKEGIYDIKYDEASKIIQGYDDIENGYADDTILPFVFELDEQNEWKDEENWVKANPAIGTVKNRDTLAEKVHRALHNELLVNNLLTKEFNVRSNVENAWLTFDEYNNEASFDLLKLRPNYAIGGLDLSKTTDLTAACILFKLPNDNKIYFEHKYFLPADIIEKRIEEDKVPYDIWVQQDYMRLSEGSVVRESDVVAWFNELREKYNIYTIKLGYDRWGFSSLLEDEFSQIVGANNLHEVRQGAQTLSAPMYRLEAELKAKNIVYNNNPITKWNISNTHVVIDNNGNIKPTKARLGRRQRIDGLAAMLNAYTIYLDNQQDYENLI